MTDDDYSDSVMVAFLPTTSEWCKQDMPHLTFIYAGELDQLTFKNRGTMIAESLIIAETVSPFTLDVEGLETFGKDDDQVDVLKLNRPDWLVRIRRPFDHLDASEYPFSPHCTIGPLGSADEVLPSSLTFDRICVAWGEELTTFELT